MFLHAAKDAADSGGVTEGGGETAGRRRSHGPRPHGRDAADALCRDAGAENRARSLGVLRLAFRAAVCGRIHDDMAIQGDAARVDLEDLVEVTRC